jgi:uncharacterized protein
MSTVFLAPLASSADDAALAAAVAALWRQAGFAELFAAKDLTAIKLHVGEPGCRTHVEPRLVAELVRLIQACGAQPFLTDTSVLYRSPRDNGVSHARVAHQHGFNLERVGAPFIPADGLNGADDVEVAVGGRHYDKVAIASAIMHARSLLVLTHATGHLGTGLGGALKNLGMGCASKRGKLRQHHAQQPKIAPDRCTACGVCAEWCPADAIAVGEHAVVDSASCIGCGECIAVCREGAVRFSWSEMGQRLQERIVEHAAAVVRGKPGRIGYLTVAQRITKDCDCMGMTQEPLLPDIGLLAARDPVAVDQAVLDLVCARSGRSLESMSYREQDGSIQIRYAEAMGLGSARYELVTVTR